VRNAFLSHDNATAVTSLKRFRRCVELAGLIKNARIYEAERGQWRIVMQNAFIKTLRACARASNRVISIYGRRAASADTVGSRAVESLVQLSPARCVSAAVILLLVFDKVGQTAEVSRAGARVHRRVATSTGRDPTRSRAKVQGPIRRS